jgi:transcriptional regulator with XRE-family HTH domain
MARKPKGPRELGRLLADFSRTKSEVAEDLGMSLGQLRHIEAGRRLPTLEQAIALEDILMIPVRHWLPEVTPKRRQISPMA